MQNEFEKQVQQKMEELDLVPSGPVWVKIEEQIRKKKDQKRILLWLPLSCLLLAGGLWWVEGGRNYPSNSLAGNTTANTAGKNTSPQTGAYSLGKTGSSGPDLPMIKKETISALPVSDDPKSPGQTKTNLLNNRVKNLSSTRADAFRVPGNRLPVESRRQTASRQVTTGHDRLIAHEQMNSGVSSPVIMGEKEKPGRKREDSSSQIKNAKGKETFVSKPTAKIDSLNIVALNRQGAKGKITRWHFGFTGSIGYSGLNSWSLFGSSRDSSSVRYTPVPPLQNNGPAAPVRKCLSFSAGVVVKKQLNNRWQLSTGLGYQLYSTKTAVGSTLYSNAYSAYTSPQLVYSSNRTHSLSGYYNKYHFLTLPVELEGRFLKKIPLSLHVGLTVLQMLSTSALQYDYPTQVYYFDKKAFYKTQVSSSFGIDYNLQYKGHNLLLGPQVQYGITRLEQTTDQHHLYAISLRAQYLFK